MSVYNNFSHGLLLLLVPQEGQTLHRSLSANPQRYFPPHSDGSKNKPGLGFATV